jgi:hypothetical protein
MTLPTPILPPRLSGQSTVVRLTAERLAQAGLSPEPLLREAGLVDVATADLDLPGAEGQAAFLNLAAEMLQDPSFGLHLGQDYDLRKLGLLFYLMGSSETVGEALSCFERFSSLDDPSIYGSYRISDIAVTVAVGSAETGRCLDRHLAEFWLVSIARLVRELAVGDAVPIGVSVSQPQRDTAEVTQGAFAAPVAFAASEDRIDFEVRLADIRLPTAEPYLHAYLLPHFERSVEAMRWEPAVVWARVKKAMAPRLPHRDDGQHRQGSRDEYAHPVAPAAGRAEDLQRDLGRTAGGTRYPLHQDQGAPDLGDRLAPGLPGGERHRRGLSPMDRHAAEPSQAQPGRRIGSVGSAGLSRADGYPTRREATLTTGAGPCGRPAPVRPGPARPPACSPRHRESS